MKKIGVNVLVIVLLFSIISTGIAQNSTDSDEFDYDDYDSTSTTDETTDTSSTTDETTQTTRNTNTVSVTESDSTGSLGDLANGFDCLEEKAGEGCKNINSVEELSLTILATPDNIMEGCIEKLESKQKDNNFGSIKDTALALLALNHAGKDTALIEKWLLEKRQNPKDLVWFLQQDSDGKVGCKIDDGTLLYEIVIDENKKINIDAGKCLKRIQSNFWYQIDPSCYSTRFKISCDLKFITSLLYKNQKASTIYVLENTQESEPLGTTEHSITSECLGQNGICDYEGTAWGAFALKVTQHSINEFIPYLISTSELKESYLPDAFIYLLTGYDNYGSRLIEKQKFATYWEAELSSHNRYYDTALALLALDIDQSQTQKARQWLLYDQGKNGCWGNVKETAFILWVLAKKSYYVEPNTVFCDEAGYYCVDLNSCSDENVLGDEYYCSGTTRVCCEELELYSCSDMGGIVCPDEEVCSGLSKQALDVDSCCLEECVIPEEPTTECESQYYRCDTECFSDEVTAPYDCNGEDVCCKSISSSGDSDDDSKGGIAWWIWVLLILIIIVIAAIIFVYRDKIKEKFKKDNDDEGQNNPSMPPRRPGMPPGRGGIPLRRPGMPIRRGGIPLRRPSGPRP